MATVLEKNVGLQMHAGARRGEETQKIRSFTFNSVANFIEDLINRP